jgi:hypothetical protein
MAKITIEFDETSPVRVNTAQGAGDGGDGGGAPSLDGTTNAAPRFGGLGMLESQAFEVSSFLSDGINAGGPPEWLFAAIQGVDLDLDLDRTIERRALDFAVDAIEVNPPNDAGAAPEL